MARHSEFDDELLVLLIFVVVHYPHLDVISSFIPRHNTTNNKRYTFTAEIRLVKYRHETVRTVFKKAVRAVTRVQNYKKLSYRRETARQLCCAYLPRLAN